MEENTTDQVALLIDFENLIYGLENIHGENYQEEVEPEIFVKLSEEYGQIVLANAYADWRFREVNQFQTDLYRLGIDILHVLGKRRNNKLKNAVDVKMAVDAIETIWTLPHVKTFVIVSGDRDFIHVLKTLRRYGKRVIGVSPEQSVSDDFATLCDRFVRYGALSSAFSGGSVKDVKSRAENINLDSVRKALREVLSGRKEGIKGAQIKPLLRRNLSVTFDESEYGFSRLTELLAALPDIVKVVINPNGGDVTVYPAEAISDNASSGTSKTNYSDTDSIIYQSGIKKFKFDQNVERRRQVLTAFFECMKSKNLFTPNDIVGEIIDEYESLKVNISTLSKYFTVLWQSRIFAVEANQKEIGVMNRQMRLSDSIATSDDLIFRYEASIIYKVAAAVKNEEMMIDTRIVCNVLGIENINRCDEYCKKILKFYNLEKN